MTESQSVKSSQHKEVTPDFLSIIGLFVAKPLLMIGLFSQAYLSLKVEWFFHVLALLSLAVGLTGFLLALSKVRKGIPYGAVLICISAFLSILFSINTDVLKDTPTIALIIIGASISALFGAINYVMYHWDLKIK